MSRERASLACVSLERAALEHAIEVVSQKTRHRGGENTEDCSYPLRATIERVLPNATIEEAALEHAPLQHIIKVVSQKVRHREGENTEDCSYLSRATFERALLEHATLERALLEHATLERALLGHATIEHATLEHAIEVVSQNVRHREGENTEDCSCLSRATVERALLEHAVLEQAALEPTVGDVTIERSPARRERGGHHLLMTSDPSTSAPRLRPDPFDSSRKDPWRSWRHGALAVNPNGGLLPTGALGVNPNLPTHALAVNPNRVLPTGALAVNPNGGLLPTGALAVNPNLPTRALAVSPNGPTGALAAVPAAAVSP